MFHSITVTLANGKKRSETEYGEGSTYYYQLNDFCNAVKKAKEDKEWRDTDLITGVDESVKIMKVIDRVYEAAGMTPRKKQNKN